MSSSVDQWSKECHQSSGLCGNSQPTNWCSGQQPCSGGSVGDLGIMSKTPQEIDESDTKFWGTHADGGLKLIGVGMLAAAGLQEGDILVAVEAFRMANRFDRQTILTWQFYTDKVSVTFIRKGRLHSSSMVNPKGKT